MSAWEKRLQTLTLHGVEQNIVLGARYFRFEVLDADPVIDLAMLGLNDAVTVLEEVSTHGRCVVVLPDEGRVVLYAVHPEAGRPELVWYARTALIAAGERST